METIIKIEGMSCGHCTSAVDGAIRKVDNVVDVEVKLEEKIAIVKHNGADLEKLKEAIEDQGFDVVE